MTIKITSDSTCDLSKELVAKYNIGIIPLYVVKDGVSLKDGLEITPEDIFAFTDSTGKLCTTAAVSQYDYTETFRPLSEQYDAVIHITISADFSSCYQNACAAAEEFPNVYVVDSRNLSTGHGHIVIEAAQLAEQGLAPEEICARLNDLTGRVEASFLLDRLDYMVKGGRCSSVVALGANLLRLKPCIEVVDNKMIVGKKYRGSYVKCMEHYVRDRLENCDDLLYDTIFITHTPVPQEILDTVHRTVRECGDFKHIYETNAGCTISCHCGEGTLGVLYLHKPKN